MSAAPRRSLAGTTILLLTPALRDDRYGRGTLDIARAALRAGAHAIVAGDGGPLAGELRGIGAEWLPMRCDTINPLRIRVNAHRLARLIADERIDIVHAQSTGAARSAAVAISRMPVFLITSLPERLPVKAWPMTALDAPLTRNNWMIAPSSYVSRTVIARHRIAPERISVIPRPVDTAAFDPAAVSGVRIAALRQAWSIPPQSRVVLVPGGIAPANGQASVIDAARLMADAGQRNIAFVFEGEAGRPRDVNNLCRKATAHGIETQCRITGSCPDIPAAMALADVVVVPAPEPPVSAQAAAEAQAMGRPVVTTAVGSLPETVLCPPRMDEDVRTGWLVPPRDAGELARAIASALALDITAYSALSARARQFAAFAFSPQSVAEAICGVYTSLLARDP